MNHSKSLPIKINQYILERNIFQELFVLNWRRTAVPDSLFNFLEHIVLQHIKSLNEMTNQCKVKICTKSTMSNNSRLSSYCRNTVLFWIYTLQSRDFDTQKAFNTSGANDQLINLIYNGVKSPFEKITYRFISRNQ